MYQLYVEKCAKETPPIKPEKRERYSNIFHSNFKLAFHQPKKDQCDVCVAHKDTINSTAYPLKEHEHRRQMKEKARNYKNAIKKMAKEDKDKKTTASCFDLQQVLNCPHGDASDFFYKRKLGVYNFSVYDLTSAAGYCYMWPEHIAGRGSNEMATCVMDYIKRKSQEGFKIIYLFSDNCPGQNRNRFIPTMLWYALSKYQLDKIEHSFLEKGHTQNENDSVHSSITRAAKKKDIYTPEQWCMTVKFARKNPSPYVVKEMTLNSMFDFKGMAKKFKNLKTDNKGDKTMWNEFRSLTTQKDDPNVMLIRYEHDGPQVRCNVMKTAQRTRKKASEGEEDFTPAEFSKLRGITQ